MVPILLALLQPQLPVTDYNVDGVTREAIVVTGAAPAPAQGRPVVFVFHGHGGNMRLTERGMHIETLWPEAIVVYPQGLPTKGKTDPEGVKNGWQQRPGAEGDRDLKFFDAMYAGLHGFDRHRVFAMGHSNGGAMTYVLWAARSDRFAAYAPSGSPMVAMPREFKPAPAFFTAGRQDPIVPFKGQALSMKLLARRDQVDLSQGKSDGSLTSYVGATGIPFCTYYHSGGHSYPPEAIQDTVDFFRRIRS